MLTCESCGKTFTRKCSLNRHKEQSCTMSQGSNDPASKRFKLDAASTSKVTCTHCNVEVDRNLVGAHNRTLQHKANTSVEVVDGVQRIQSAFKCRISSFRITPNNKYANYERFFEDIREKTIKVIQDELEIHRAVKINMEVFSLYVLETQEIFSIKSFNTTNRIVDVSSNMNDIYDTFKEVMMTKAEEFEERESAGETYYKCSKIDYFSKDEYSRDPNDSTLAIPYTVTKSGLFFLIGTGLLIAAYGSCIIGQCAKHKRFFTFFSGILFIFTGLTMLLGLIMYISTFKSETGSKLRPPSQVQSPLFEYSYGYSFLLYVIGLISTKISGIGCVFLFIYRIQYEWKRKQNEELKRGKRTSAPLNFGQINHAAYYPCRRHPYAYINSNSTIHFPAEIPHDKRYYFSKEPVQESPCSVHRIRSQSNSLKDVSNFYDFPPPPTISYQFDDHFNDREQRAFPRDVTLNTVNTVSTTADVNCDELNDPFFDEYSPSIQHEFVTFDLDQPLPVRAQSILSISSRNGGTNNRKTFESDSLRRTTPV